MYRYKCFSCVFLMVFVLIGCRQQSMTSVIFEVTNSALVQTKLASFTVEDMVKHVQEELDLYLPKEAKLGDTIHLNFVDYTERGSYANKDSIVIDLSDLDTITDLRIKHLIAHEVHHVLYMKWMLNTVRKSPEDDQQLVLSWWQYRILSEGIAQLINFPDYPDQIKKLYKNEQLLKELIDFWVDNQRRLAVSDNPKQTYSDIQSYMWNEWSRNKLEAYLLNAEHLTQHRPTVDYYLSYHIYSRVLAQKGEAALYDVICNPKALLKMYNSISPDSLKIPDDIVRLWESNYIEYVPIKS